MASEEVGLGGAVQDLEFFQNNPVSHRLKLKQVDAYVINHKVDNLKLIGEILFGSTFSLVKKRQQDGFILF